MKEDGGAYADAVMVQADMVTACFEQRSAAIPTELTGDGAQRMRPSFPRGWREGGWRGCK